MRVLLIDDEASYRSALEKVISAWGHKVETAVDGVDGLEKIAIFHPHVIITDLRMPRMDGFELLRRLKAEGCRIPSIVLTAFGNTETAVATIHDLGAYWFIERPIDIETLRVLLERVRGQVSLIEEAERLGRMMSYQGVLEDIVGVSAPMQTVFSLICQVAPTSASVLITGESGTGKELVARALHKLSGRRDGPFVAVNCAALPETLIESELFGHEKGAFTGALARRSGCFQLAEAGTLFLDEIGEMPVNTQSKLLRVLEDSRVRPLGGKEEQRVDVRILTATNKTPETAIKKGELRQDLYYRLNVFQIHLPALRERMEDLPVLIQSLLTVTNRKHGCAVTDVDPAVMAVFREYRWPGNVRELRNVLERAAVIARQGTVQLEHLPQGFASRPQSAESAEGELRLPYGITMDEAEKRIILHTLARTQENRKRSADILGISVKTIMNKLKQYREQDQKAAAAGVAGE